MIHLCFVILLHRWALKKTISNNEKSINSHDQKVSESIFTVMWLLDWTKQRRNIYKANVGE